MKPFQTTTWPGYRTTLLRIERSRLPSVHGVVEAPPVENASSMPTGSPRSTSSYSAGSNEATSTGLPSRM